MNNQRDPALHTRASQRIHIPVALMMMLSGCSDPSTPGTPRDARIADSGPRPGDAGDGTGRPLFRSCLSGTLPANLPTVDWSNLSNEVITLATPWHSAQDIIAAQGGSTVLAAKFSYGSISKDLQGERIEVWMDDCAGSVTRLGERVTDSDGRIAYPLDASQMPGIGEYKLHFRVMGDSSAALATLRVYPPNTRFIIFDIDATLTTSDSELVGQVVSEILDNHVVPEARQGSVDITRLRHEQHDYELVYLTGRPYLLMDLTREWLDDLGFPGGTVRLTDSVAASWPSESQVGEYKADYLLSAILGQGFLIYAAYGNATSDIYAYEQAGITKERTYILGEHGGESQTTALGETYVEHLGVVSSEAPAAQPFRR